MKKFLIALALTGCASGALAQIGITAGMNLAKYSYAQKRFDVHRKSILGYNFGVQYKQRLSEKWFLLPELSYALKGARVYYDYPIGATGPMKDVNRFQYLQLNLPVVLALPISDAFDFEVGAGLFAACLLKATQKTVEFDDSYATRSFASGDLKKMDAGLSFTTGFRMSKMLGLHFSYNLGLVNIQQQASAPTARTRNFSINLSWIFSKND
jgi:hypothetical protein